MKLNVKLKAALILAELDQRLAEVRDGDAALRASIEKWRKINERSKNETRRERFS